MLKRLRYLTLSFSFLFVLCGPGFVHADSPEAPTDPSLPIVLTEIYPNAPGSKESGNDPTSDPLANEYVELFNTTSISIELSYFVLSRDGSATTTSLDGLTIEPHGYLVILPDFSLINGGGTLHLSYEYPDLDSKIDSYTYPGDIPDTHSWSLIDNIWEQAVPSPNETNPPPIPIDIPEEESNEEETPEEPIETSCQVDVTITEIVANPKGSDSDGGEFIELFNNNDKPALLTGCMLSTDKAPAIQLADISLESGAYIAIMLSNDLLNGGGTVQFTSDDEEDVVTYPALSDDESWSLINGAWQMSKVSTPNAKNVSTPAEEPTVIKSTALEPCPEGKFRNPETNRCKTIVETVSELLPCNPGSTRNPETNRCRKIASSISSTLTPCKANQERNPETNRCRSIASTTSSEPKPCDEGYERNSETNRCRKVAEVLSGATIETPDKEAGLHTGVFLFMSILVISYGVYEYRLDFQNLIHKIRERRLIKFLPKQR